MTNTSVDIWDQYICSSEPVPSTNDGQVGRGNKNKTRQHLTSQPLKGVTAMRKLYVFDTTLRDGEQSLGITLNANEKIEIARQLVRLGVDIIEAGFPASSPGDLEAVKRIGAEVKGVVVCGLTRAVRSDIDKCVEAL